MATKRHLKSAPIVEAVLDIQVRLPSAIGYQALSPFADLVADRYPTRRERHHVLAQWQTTPDGQVSQTGTRTPVGYLMTSAEGTEVVQARIDGFSFSRLAPYTDWSAVKAEARRLWLLYIDVVKPEVSTRISLRYINRIHLPIPIADFREYINTGPTIAAGIPQELSHFFFQAVIPAPESNATIVINETVEPATEAFQLPLILDIDVSRVELNDPPSDSLWQAFDTICAIKDDVFFASLTEKTMESFE